MEIILISILATISITLSLIVFKDYKTLSTNVITFQEQLREFNRIISTFSEELKVINQSQISVVKIKEQMDTKLRQVDEMNNKVNAIMLNKKI